MKDYLKKLMVEGASRHVGRRKCCDIITYRGACTRFKAVFSLSTLKLISRSTIFSSALVPQSAETAARGEVAPVVEI